MKSFSRMTSSRLAKLVSPLLVSVCALSLSLPAYAQNFDKVEIKSADLGNGVHALFGAGGNIGMLAGDDGVFLIDDQFAPLTEKILRAVRRTDEGTIRFLLNTHWHFDHTGGNENMARHAHVNIIAHDNVRATMAVPQELKAFNRKVPASPAIALPVLTYSDGATLHLNGETVNIMHVPNAHTDGDSIVQFENADVIHMGDTFFNGFFPFIDVEHGGSVAGMIGAADKVLGMSTDSTQIIPGHGPIANRIALSAFRDMLKAMQDLVTTAKANGQGPEQLAQSDAFKAIDEKWGNGFLKGPIFLKLAFAGVK